jgi:hypothetical protein
MWEPKGLPLGEIGAIRLFKVFAFERRQQSLGGPLILIVGDLK